MSGKLKRCEGTLSCLRAALNPIWLQNCSLPWEKDLGTGGCPAGGGPTLEGGSGKELRWRLLLLSAAAAQKWGKFPYSWVGSELWSFDVCLSPQHHPFSKSQDPGKECSQSASCSAFAFVWICCKRKARLQWKSKEASLFLPYGCVYWKPKGETLCRLGLMRLIQLPHKTQHTITDFKGSWISPPESIQSHEIASVWQILSLITIPASGSVQHKHFFFQASHSLRFYILNCWVSRTFIYTTFIFSRSHRQFSDWSIGERKKWKEKNNQRSLEKSWGMQCLVLKHWWVSSSSCNSSLRDALRVSPTESWGSTQCSSAQPLTRGKWEAEADWASLSHAEKGGKSKAEGKNAGRHFCINGRKQGSTISF